MHYARWFTSITTDTNTRVRHVIQKENISKRGKNHSIQTKRSLVWRQQLKGSSQTNRPIIWQDPVLFNNGLMGTSNCFTGYDWAPIFTAMVLTTSYLLILRASMELTG